MKTLGIDYGRKKIGLAVSEGTLAEPWRVVGQNELKEILKNEKFDKIVVGISAGKMGEEQREFAKSLGAETFDETLTTKEAQALSLEAGISRKKRHGMEDAFAATLILQSFLDLNG